MKDSDKSNLVVAITILVALVALFIVDPNSVF